jgi:hypothetical protein
MRSLISCWVVAALCTASLGCTRETKSELSVVPSQDIVVGVGTVVFLNIEGGFYALVSDDRVTYEPQSLPDDFMIDGLRVRFTIRIVQGAMSFRQVGPIVEVLDIRRLI